MSFSYFFSAGKYFFFFFFFFSLFFFFFFFVDGNRFGIVSISEDQLRLFGFDYSCFLLGILFLFGLYRVHFSLFPVFPPWPAARKRYP